MLGFVSGAAFPLIMSSARDSGCVSKETVGPMKEDHSFNRLSTCG